MKCPICNEQTENNGLIMWCANAHVCNVHFVERGREAMKEKSDSTKRIYYIRSARRRWGFQVGHSFIAVKECISRENAKPKLSFIVALTDEQTENEIERLVRSEILKRINQQ
jgi:hypothetical protein